MKDYRIYWRYNNSTDIMCEHIQATCMSYAIEQALEYISEVEQLGLEDIYICHVEVLE